MPFEIFQTGKICKSEIMQYAILIFVLIVGAMVGYRIAMPQYTPTFTLMGGLSSEKLGFLVSSLAMRSKNYTERGKGLGVSVIKKYVKKAFTVIAKKVKNGEDCLEFERWIYDNYFKLNEVILALEKNKFLFYNLPHVDGLPRIYTLMELVVKCNEGYVSSEQLESAINAYNALSPLAYKEICAVKITLQYALMEYIAIFCGKAVKINSLIKQGKIDAASGKINFCFIKNNSYIFGFSDKCDEKIKRDIEVACLNNGNDFSSRLDAFYVMSAKYNGFTSCAITSLNRLEYECTDEFIFSLFSVYETLRDVGNFSTLTNATKALYLRCIAALAKKKRQSEGAVASDIIDRVKRYNIDMASCILPPCKSNKFFALYVVAVALMAAIFAVFIWWFSRKFFILTLLVSLPILMALAASIVTKIILFATRRREMPAVASLYLDPIKSRTAIVIPQLVACVAEIDGAFTHLATIMSANNASIFSYSLLLDFPSCEGNSVAKYDEEFLSRIKINYEKIAEKDRVCVIVRKRKVVADSNIYQGYEKKRGSLIEFNRYLLTGENDFYLRLGEARNVAYAITLDSDTLLNSCAQLVEFISHPYNKNYNVISINMRAKNFGSSLFARAFCGEVGLDNYSNFNSNFEYDVFGAGNFTGKGIYRVKEFNEKTGDAFGANRILSHDYIEGAYGSCSNANIKALDEFPKTFSSYITRSLRWARGDWQLLPFLFSHVKNAGGERVKNPIKPINKWHIFCNLLYSILPISSFLALVVSLFHPYPAALILLSFSMPLYSVILMSRHIFFHPLLVLKAFLSELYFVAMLPVTASLYFWAIGKTIIRLFTHKKLLEWKVFAHSNARVTLLAGAVAAIIFTASAIIFSLSPLYYFLAAGYIVAILVTKLLDRDIAVGAKEKSNCELTSVAKDTFAYFSACVIEENNYLPCDNYQEHNGKGWATRTSPTNIGFGFVAYISALELGVIDRAEFDEKIGKMIDTVEKLDKWHGNLYNWVDVCSLRVLSPRYISSVDSGNFLACLVLLKTYCEGKLKDRVNKLIEETDLRALYDERRGLLYIGYNEYSSERGGHYDLMGSESALSYLVGVGLGKLPKDAWGNLSRSLVKYKGATLYSWTGGMFEYLMSRLFFEFPVNSLMDNAACNAVNAQIYHARKRNLSAWGMSECQYSAEDDGGNYQYKAFGVPNIAYSNISETNMIAPYASFLSLPYAENIAMENLKSLKFAYGKFGYYESLDIKSRLVIRSYMAHHQGMILASICNYFGDTLTKNFQQEPQMRAAELLLTETSYADAKKKYILPATLKSLAITPLEGENLSMPYVNLLGNAHYKLVNASNGGGYSVFGGQMITRFGVKGDGIKVFAEFGGEKFDLMSGKFTAGEANTSFDISCAKFISKIDVVVLPVLDGHAIRLEFTYLGDKALDIAFYSYGEVALNNMNADISHPAFSKMFVETGVDSGFMWAKRNGENAFYAAHFLPQVDALYLGGRNTFYSRGQKTDFGSTLDPIFCAKTTLKLAPYQKIELNFFTLCSYDFEKLKYMVKLASSPRYLDRCRSSAYALSKYANTTRNTKLIAAKLLYGSANTRVSHIANTNPTRPVVCLEVQNSNSIERLGKKLQEVKTLFSFNLSFNVIVLYKEKYSGYLQLTDQINSKIRDEQVLKYINEGSTFNVVNYTNSEVLAQSVRDNAVDIDFISSKQLPKKVLAPGQVYENAKMEMYDIVTPLGLGGFMKDYSYAMDISRADTPAPWSNIIANKNFGTIITEAGGGYTYAGNSRENKLTVWSNDPILDSPSESIILGENDILWSVTKKPIQTLSDYYVCHSFGYSEFRNNYNGILSTEKIFISKDEDVKYYVVTMYNDSPVARNIDVCLALDIVLGDHKINTNCSVCVEKISANTFKATNKMKKSSMYIRSDTDFSSYTTKLAAVKNEKGEFIAASNFSDGGSIPYFAASVNVFIASKTSEKIIFSIGADSNSSVDGKIVDEIAYTAYKYYAHLGGIELKCDTNLKYMLKWLPYQALCSRFYGRTGFYQAGGAFGFRDQLQDALAVLYIEPGEAREHILRAASHQFARGDVMHWWHEPAIGVRTKFCDDRLFLPYFVAEYIGFTRDYEIIAERAPFLADIPIGEHDSSVYASVGYTENMASILDHCLLAIDVSCDFGENGLVKMRGGDWNDAMDEVGKRGEGVSVWCSMFLYYVINKFLPYINDKPTRERYKAVAARLVMAVDKTWDGDRYTRAITDDGVALGSRDSIECSIDLLSQSWATLSGIAPLPRCNIALSSVENLLVDRKNKLVKLLSPPIKEMRNIGYISRYPEGVRENGGQYTHAAIWYAMALYKLGKNDRAYEILEMINPIEHCLTAKDVKKYCLEPYVIAADVYSGEKAGRGGWSWYTGSAAWMYKAIVENMLGIEFCGKSVKFSPCLPSQFDVVGVSVRTAIGNIDVEIINKQSEGDWKVKVGNVTYNTNSINLSTQLLGKKITVYRS